MSRISIKAVGSSGQGLNSIGEVIAKGAKRSGYCVFGYREYPSLIRGGHASYQIDIDNAQIRSSQSTVDMLITLDHHGFGFNLRDVKVGGIIIHSVVGWKFTEEDQGWINDNGIKIIYIPIEELLQKIGGQPILANVLLTSFVWSALGLDIQLLRDLVGGQYKHKGPEVVAKNMQCIDEGSSYIDLKVGKVNISLPKPFETWKDQLLITGSAAMGLGAIHAGMRLYAGYPMTPSSPLLTYIASVQNATGVLVKQAEDEITAAQMVVGAMHMGTRAMTATSGGGYDLMTETVSMAGMTETPMVVVLAQRPGPATGNPTYTAQGDLLLAVNSSHGEFPRCVMSVSDADTCFSRMPEAFNMAEEFQLPVVVLTDKHIAEGIFTTPEFDQTKTEIRRGKIITYPEELQRLDSSDRYDLAAVNGISPRWLPGTQAATFCGQSDEHSPDGSVDESAEAAKTQMDKRMRKMTALKRSLPQPELYIYSNGTLIMSGEPHSLDILLVGWGSTKGVALDLLTGMEELSIGYLHYSYIWPLRTEMLSDLAASSKRAVLIEGNYQGQLGRLIRQECGLEFVDKILKYNGRPFFLDELIDELRTNSGYKSNDESEA